MRTRFRQVGGQAISFRSFCRWYSLGCLVLLGVLLASGCGGGPSAISGSGETGTVTRPGGALQEAPPAPPNLEDWKGRLSVSPSANLRISPALVAGQVSGNLDLKDGWNMVSLPLAEVTGLEPGPGVFETAFVWDASEPGKSGYRQVNLHDPATLGAEGTDLGMWVYSDGVSQIGYSGWPNSGAHANAEVTLNAGWNLLGYPYDQAQPFSKAQVKAEGASGTARGLPQSVSSTTPRPGPEILLYGSGYLWGDGSYSALDLSVPTGTFQVGRALWVYVYQDGTLLRYGSAPASAPAGGAIGVGCDHSLWVRPDGTVWAWGQNDMGQLGTGTNQDEATPVRVSNLSGIVSVGVSWDHSLALSQDGTVWAWGDNEWGKLGDGSEVDRPTPVRVLELSEVVAVDAGILHSLALKKDGSVWAWGPTLGDAYNIFKTPVRVVGASDVVAVSSGYSHSLALRGDGRVLAWGPNNSHGELGNGTFTPPPPAVSEVAGLTDIVAISAGGDYSLALKRDGTVWAWGYNVFRQLGDGTQVDRATPVRVPGLSEIVAVSAGNSHSLALQKDGTVWAWGDNWYGQLGDGTREERATPVKVAGLSGLTAVAAGNGHSLALDRAGTVWAWGVNYFGQLGDGTQDVRATPVPVWSLPLVLAPTGARTAAGGAHSLQVHADGTVSTWGRNQVGQLGDGSTAPRSTPVQVKGLADAVAVAGGQDHSLALKSDGTVWAWGTNAAGQLGTGTPSDNQGAPQQVSELTRMVAVAANGKHSLALKDNGTVWAWGDNQYGQLGDGSTTARFQPVQVQGLTGVVALACGDTHSLALRGDGMVWAWGRNDLGQLGIANVTDQKTPVPVQRLSGVIAIAGGDAHSLALRGDGTVWAWGDNLFGQQDDSVGFPRLLPEQVQGLSGVQTVAAGEKHGLALKNDGTAWAWGLNTNGQLGDGSRTDRFGPVQIQAPADVVAVFAGDGHSLAVNSDGTWAWGANDDGQLGDGTETDSTSPELALADMTHSAQAPVIPAGAFSGNPEDGGLYRIAYTGDQRLQVDLTLANQDTANRAGVFLVDQRGRRLGQTTVTGTVVSCLWETLMGRDVYLKVAAREGAWFDYSCMVNLTQSPRGTITVFVNATRDDLRTDMPGIDEVTAEVSGVGSVEWVTAMYVNGFGGRWDNATYNRDRQMRVPYGTYTVTAHCGDKSETRTIQVGEWTGGVEFNFEFP